MSNFANWSAQDRAELEAQIRVKGGLVEDVYPCTPLQEGLMALSSKIPGTYISHFVLRLSPALNLKRLRMAWESTAHTHPIMRTKIINTGTVGSLQVVFHQVISWQFATDLQAHLNEARHCKLSYGQQLTRYTIVREDHCNMFLVWTVHTVVCDSWTLPMVLEQVKSSYLGISPTITVPFRKFIERLSSFDASLSDRFWQKRLEGSLSVRFPALPSATYQPLVDQLSVHEMALTRQIGSTTSTTTLIRAAWAIIVAMYSNVDDVIFGETLSGRNSHMPCFKGMIGPMSTTIPIRIFVDRGQTVTDFLNTIQEQACDSIPFEHAGLQNIKRLGLDAEKACDFQNLLIIQSTEEICTQKDFQSLQNTTMSSSEFYSYPLVMICLCQEERIRIECHCDVNVLPMGQIRHLLSQFEHVMQELNDTTSRTLVGEIDFVSSLDQRQITRWNGEYPQTIEACIHHVFEEQVKARPDAPALCSWDASFSYRELDDSATRLAHRLVTLGVGSEVLVPLCFEKSLWTVVSMLAVLKAGGACVTINPSDPISRMETMVRDTMAKVVLCSPSCVGLFEQMVKHVVTIEHSFVQQLPAISRPASETVSPRNTAFVIFTSGSTGNPKGVVLDHAALCTSSEANGVAKFINSDSRVLQFSSYAFDVCIQDILFTLMRGGCVCIPSEQDRIANLAKTINEMDVNWLFLTPAVVTLLDPQDIPSVKTLTLGGEALTTDNVRIWGSNVKLLNGYGPAECSVCCAAHEFVESNEDPRNIGKAVGSWLWVVDSSNHNRLTPIGCVGELLLEGPMLARGYLNDKQKTAKAFIEDPAWALDHRSGQKKRRFYKTGDLVRYDADGCLHYVGRKDDQVKLLGQRVELGEIEYHLRAQRQITQTLVVLPTTGRFSKSLTAVVSLEALTMASMSKTPLKLIGHDQKKLAASQVSDIRDVLSDLLPRYMIPTVWITVESLPLTSSGKIDRVKISRWIAEIDDETYTWIEELVKEEETGVAMTTVEQQLQQAWSQVLNVPPNQIKRQSSFLRLGGDSICAMKLVGVMSGISLSLSVADIFRHPKLSEMSKVAFSSPSQADVELAPFALLDRQEGVVSLLTDIATQCAVDPDAVEDIYPSTPLQEGLMMLTTRQSGSYVWQTVYKMPETLEIDRFRAAWQLVVRASPILRTRLVNEKRLATFQVVLRDEFVWMEEQSELDAYLIRDERNTMAFGSPMTRFAVIDRHFVMTIHHAVYDGWSMPSILEDVISAYKISCVDTRPPFKNFIRFLQNVDTKASEAYWEAQFSGNTTSHYPPLPSATYQPMTNASEEVVICFSRQQGSDITTATLVRAAWALALARYADSSDVTFGVTVSGRDAPVQGIAEMTGPTIATVPVRIQVDYDITVPAFLKCIQNQSIEMIPHEHFGLQNIKRISGDADRGCNFHSSLVVYPIRKTNDTLDSIGMEKVRDNLADVRTYGILISCTITLSGIQLKAYFDDALMNAGHMRALLGFLRGIIQQMCLEDTSTTILDACQLSTDEQRMIEDRNAKVPSAVNECVHNLVSQQAVARPEAPAICSWDGDFTYRELDTLSTRLAHHLIDLDVGPEIMVPLCFDKSAWTLVAMLAVLKAGGGFVPLDPSHPRLRLQEAVENVRANFILCSPRHESLARSMSQRIFVVSQATLEILPEKGSPPHNDVKPQNVAYVMFTSGSTGKAKGVVIEHQTICTAAQEHGRVCNLNAQSRVLNFASYVFDASLLEMLTTLLHGGCVCVPSERERLEDLTGTIDRLKVNWAFFTPSVIRMIQPLQVPTLRTLVLGGEALGTDNIKVWAAKVLLMNGYGPTECCIFSVVNTEVLVKDDPALLGRVVGGACWIVDSQNHDQLLPMGCVGEMLIEGPLLARGYLNDAAKTAAAFIENPKWLSDIGSGQRRRFYKTGDLVRCNADGTMNFVGRKDTQIKIHGQRIEIGEIEHQLRQNLPILAQVVVEQAPLCGQSGRGVLVAFIAFASHMFFEYEHDDLALKPTDTWRTMVLELESRLKDTLMSYMIPTIYIPVARIPVSVAGKTDRSKLRRMASELSVEQISLYSFVDEKKRTPSTKSERQLQRLWASVLDINIGLVGVDDSFFRLGGDSIDAMRLAAAARETNLSLTVADIFRTPRLGEMAKAVEDIKGMPHLPPEPFALLGELTETESVLQRVEAQYGIPRELVHDAYPCTPLQEGLMVLSISQPGAYVNQDVFRLSASLDVARFVTAWQLVIERNPILRTRIVHFEPLGSLQVVLNSTATWRASESLIAYLKDDRSFPMDYGEPLTRYAMIEDGPERFFIWTAHHSVYDGWSCSLILKEVEWIYHHHDPAKSAAVVLAESSTPSYANFVEHVSATNVDAAKAFWQSQLSRVTQPSFPMSASDAHQPRPDASLNHSISLSRSTGSDHTMPTVLRGAWAIVVARYSESDTAVFGMTLTGRNAPVKGIAQMTGPTIATVPIQVVLHQGQTVAEYLLDIQEQATDMIPFEHTGLQNIKKLVPEAQGACNFQSLLVIAHEGQSDMTSELWELEELVDRGPGFFTYALVLNCKVSEGRVDVNVEYDTRFIATVQMRRMIHHLGNVVKQLTSNL